MGFTIFEVWLSAAGWNWRLRSIQGADMPNGTEDTEADACQVGARRWAKAIIQDEAICYSPGGEPTLSDAHDIMGRLLGAEVAR